MFQRVEETDKEDARQIDQEIRPDERQQFVRLSDVFKIEIEEGHDGCKQQADNTVGHKRVFHFSSYGFVLSHTIESSYDRRQSVGETHIGDKNKTEDIVDQAGGSQFFCAVMTYHERIGKTEYDGAQLADDNGNAQHEQFAVMMSLL